MENMWEIILFIAEGSGMIVKLGRQNFRKNWHHNQTYIYLLCLDTVENQFVFDPDFHTELIIKGEIKDSGNLFIYNQGHHLCSKLS